MRTLIPILTLVLAATALSGCAAATTSGAANSSSSGSSSSGSSSSGGSSGGGATAANECSIAHDALAKFVTSLSAPYQKGNVCNFGVGPNSTKSGAALGQLYGDTLNVRLVTSDIDSEYQGAKDSYSPTTPLSGVGTEAEYHDGGNGNPQVFARNATDFCDVQTSFNDASEVGLTKPSGSRTISAADVPKLASELGSVCSALFAGKP